MNQLRKFESALGMWAKSQDILTGYHQDVNRHLAK